MKKRVYAIAGRILDSWIQFRGKRLSIQLEKELSLLEPGKEGSKLTYQYYREKIAMLLLVIPIGLFLILIIGMQEWNQSVIEREWFIPRNEWGAGEKELLLDVRVSEEKDYELDVIVDERGLTQTEAKRMISKVKALLPTLILGENESLKAVSRPLQLMNTLEEYPVTIRWESSEYGLLEEDGSLGENKVIESGEKVILYATIACENLQEETTYEVTILPPDMTKEEKTLLDIKEEVIKLSQETRTDSYMKLPQVINGETIIWQEKKTPIALLLTGMLFITAAAIFLGRDKDIHRKYQERNQALLVEYSEFVSKLQLLLGCGMNLRTAFEKMGRDYEKMRREGGRKKYVYEEVLLTNRKMEGGLSETEGYDLWGKRCGLLCYRKLTSLLIQNLKKGSDGLLYAMENETKAAFEERKQKARRTGEEAGTKLLFPMMLMLLVVMIIIMIPAYLSFGI